MTIGQIGCGMPNCQTCKAGMPVFTVLQCSSPGCTHLAKRGESYCTDCISRQVEATRNSVRKVLPDAAYERASAILDSEEGDSNVVY